MARRGRDDRWPHAAIITLRTFQLIFAVLNPFICAMFGSGYTPFPLPLPPRPIPGLTKRNSFFLYTFGLGILTVIYTITCLICYCCGKMHPLSLAIIAFIACFLWTFGVASAGYWRYGWYGGGYGLLLVAVALIELWVSLSPF